MAIVKVEKNSYTVESLYQWDLNQVLQIYGLSLPTTPEIHFTNDAMGCAIGRRASMDAAGVVTVGIPNSMLQKPYKIYAYVCVQTGETFESLYKIAIPVKARTKPGDYTLEVSDDEVYSFTSLKKLVNDTVAETAETLARAEVTYNESVKNIQDAEKTLGEALAQVNETSENMITRVETVLNEKEGEIDRNVNEALSRITVDNIGAAPKLHTHGSITDDGKLGTNADTVLITGAGGVIKSVSYDVLRSSMQVPTVTEMETAIENINTSTVTIDNAITSTGTNPVSGKAVYEYIAAITDFEGVTF